MEKKDVWASGDSYEPYVVRWSRLVAKEFLAWIKAQAQSRWLDVGCGTGALSQTILSLCDPGSVKGVDRSDGFVEYARGKVVDARVAFETGDAQSLPVNDQEHDVAVAGLVLNFVPEPDKMASEMRRAVVDGGIVALYDGEGVHALKAPFHGRPFSLKITLPPLSVVVFKPVTQG